MDYSVVEIKLSRNDCIDIQVFIMCSHVISHQNNMIIPFITATYIGFLPVCHNVVF